jgi:hypothetical protein
MLTFIMALVTFKNVRKSDYCNQKTKEFKF